MNNDEKLIEPTAIAQALRVALFNEFGEMSDADVLARSCGHTALDATKWLSKAAQTRISELQFTYNPIPSLRTPARRHMLLTDQQRIVATGHPSIFPEDCELYAALPAYELDGAILHGIEWGEMAWYLRELLMHRALALPEYLHNLNNLATWWHFPHDVVGEPGMISYVPDHAYGKLQRRVKTKVGKYLTKYYADQLTAEQIRDVANLAVTGGIVLSTDPKDFVRAYREGPSSCMAGEKFREDEAHPALAYTFPGEFAMAMIEKTPGSISARAIVHMPSKSIVRLYGNDANRLQSKLEQQGFTKVDRYPYGTKFKHIPHFIHGASHVRLPYIDGGARHVKFVPETDTVAAHWVLYNENANTGQPDAAARSDFKIYASSDHCTHRFNFSNKPCAHCGERLGEGGRRVIMRVENGEPVVEEICESHVGRQEPEQFVGLYSQGDTIACRASLLPLLGVLVGGPSGSWIRNTPEARSHHGVVTNADGTLDFASNCFDLDWERGCEDNSGHRFVHRIAAADTPADQVYVLREGALSWEEGEQMSAVAPLTEVTLDWFVRLEDNHVTWFAAPDSDRTDAAEWDGGYGYLTIRRAIEIIGFDRLQRYVFHHGLGTLPRDTVIAHLRALHAAATAEKEVA